MLSQYISNSVKGVKSYNRVLKAAQDQNVLRALFAPVTQSHNAVQQRAFSTSGKSASQRSALAASQTILNKQLHYLHCSKVSAALNPSDDFIPRHLGNDVKNTQEILKTLGVKSIDELMDQTVPQSIRLPADKVCVHNGKDIKGIFSETLMLSHLKDLANANKVNRSFQGAGFYPTQIPSVIRRNVLENPNWYTPYTPYQAEISQGRLESLLNYQTMITELTGLDVANASLLDEASSASEAMFMAYNVHNGKRNKFFLSKHIFP